MGSSIFFLPWPFTQFYLHPLLLSGRSLQQSDANLTSVEVYVPVNSTLKHQRCRSFCFWKFVSLHPICKIEFHLRPESFLSIREYASYYRQPLLRRVVGQYIELETLPYLNFRLHLNSCLPSQPPQWSLNECYGDNGMVRR